MSNRICGPAVRHISFAAVLAVSEYSLFSRVLWRDEAQAVMIAYHSASIGVLLSHMGYEGTPGLWHMLLYAGRMAGLQSWWDLKLWTAAITAVSLYVLFYRLDVPWEIGMVYGVGFQLATYSVIARSYGLSVLLLLIFGVLERRWRLRPRWALTVWIAMVLFLLLQTNIHSVLIGAGIFIYLSADNLSGRRPVSWVPLAAMVVSVILAVWQVAPPGDLGVGAGWLLSDTLVRFLFSLAYIGGLLVFSYGAFGAFLWLGRVGLIIMLTSFWSIAIWALRRGLRKMDVGRVIAAIGVPVVLLVLLSAFKYPVAPRQLYLLLPYGLSIWAIEGKGPGLRAFRVLLLAGVLTAWGSWVPLGLTTVTANDQQVVSWLVSHGYGSYLRTGRVAVYPDPEVADVALYGDLNNGAWAVGAQRYETYTPWDKKEPNTPMIDPGVSAVLTPDLPGRPGKYLLINYYPDNIVAPKGVRITVLTRIQNGWMQRWSGSVDADIDLVKHSPAHARQGSLRGGSFSSRDESFLFH